VVPSHPIFHEPLRVDLKFEDVPTPDNYFQLAGDKKLDKTIKVWRVQTKKFPEIDPGLVSNPMGFHDSPDAEMISSGLNSKGPDSVALARHANFFLWGFSASPPDMTPEARKGFINAVCYIKRFDGQRPIVRKVGAGYTRDGALWGAYHLRHVLDERTFWRELPPLIRYNPVQYANYRKSYIPCSAHLSELYSHKGLAAKRFFGFRRANWHRYLNRRKGLRRVIRTRCAESRK
jgi:hypothetical protein